MLTYDHVVKMHSSSRNYFLPSLTYQKIECLICIVKIQHIFIIDFPWHFTPYKMFIHVMLYIERNTEIWTLLPFVSVDFWTSECWYFYRLLYLTYRKIRKEFSFGLSVVINVPSGSWNSQNIILYLTKLNHSLKSRIWGTEIVIPNPTTSTMLWCQWSMRWGYRNISKWGCEEWYTFQFWGVRSMHFNQKEMI